MIEPNEVIIYIFVAGAAATAIWRFMGFVLSSGLAQEGPLIQWVNAVSIALVAGLISRLVLFPPGALANITLVVRLGAFAFGVLIYFLTKRRMGISIFFGTLALIAADLTDL